MEFLEVPIYDSDLLKLLVRFMINLTVGFIVVFLCYFRHKRNRAYVFTFVMMNVMVFFICFTLKKLDLGLGMALGLFAIFAIIRYRTDAIQVKEMTYLFILIGVAVINALSNKKTSYSELMVTNVVIVGATFLLESGLSIEKSQKQAVTYDRLELIAPARKAELLADLEHRLGRKPEDVKIGKIDLDKAVASLTVYFPSSTS